MSHLTPPQTHPAALYLALSLTVDHCRCIFQSELIFRTQQDFESSTGPDIISDTSLILLDRVFDNSHCVIVTRVNEHRFASDFGHLLVISQNLSASENQG